MYKKLKERITETTQYYLLRNVHPRAEQPFQVRDDEEMQELVESIRMNGVLNPLIVTPRRGGYEIVSGHRRYAACQKLGVETIPVIVRDLDPDEATLCMIDSNLHREHLLPSEKAYAYKAKMEVLNRQGQRYGQGPGEYRRDGSETLPPDGRKSDLSWAHSRKFPPRYRNNRSHPCGHPTGTARWRCSHLHPAGAILTHPAA